MLYLIKSGNRGGLRRKKVSPSTSIALRRFSRSMHSSKVVTVAGLQLVTKAMVYGSTSPPLPVRSDSPRVKGTSRLCTSVSSGASLTCLINLLDGRDVVLISYPLKASRISGLNVDKALMLPTIHLSASREVIYSITIFKVSPARTSFDISYSNSIA